MAIKVKKTYPLWFQYEVLLKEEHPEHHQWSGGLVNIIVFAANEDEGKLKCGMHIRTMDLAIKELKRASAVHPASLENTGPIFRDLYKKAERAGIAARFDGWKTES